MLAQYQYDGAGRVNRLRQGNGVETRYGYGDDGTLSELTAVMPDGKVLLNLSYAYDGNGNCIRKGKDRYAYDSRNRLTEASYDGRWERYTYDHAGNRLSKETAAGCERYTYNALNQLTSLTKPDGAQTLYAYDSRGNLLEERGGRNRSYAYDALGRLIEADTENAVCRYHYDGEGMRYRSERDGVPSYSFYDRGSLLWEGSHPGSGIRYTRGVDTVCSEQGEGNRHHHVRDELGSALFLLDEAHNITKACRYDAFGNLLEESGQAPNRLLYTGQEYDRETGQYYLRARYYSPETGRFTQEDTYRGDGLNLYAYCANNPVKYVDPTGHMMCPEGATSSMNEGDSGVWDMPEGGGIMHGREYSQHAMERMAPDTPEVRAELNMRAEKLAQSKGLQVGTQEYYQFCQKYVDPRGIPPLVVEDAIINTTAIAGHTAGTYVHQTADVKVIINAFGKVITVMPR